ncbi:hypothetical protein [Desertivirga brevis]|uniref:hypothetical protein n=1 Tax=Desertivirga brevis TaxID=2810310 RepID=UPI001A9565DE|nr:hypothetical protein [Pedobacter sp. SYSU D00873]
MDRIRIEVQKSTEVINFEIVDYIHHRHHHCKFDVFKGEELVASFEPDQYGYLHICKNPGKLDSELLHQLAEKIESYNLSGN